jgi:hypothetical protein
MPTAAASTSTRHAIVDSPTGPLTLVPDDNGRDQKVYLLELEKRIPASSQPLW